MRIKTPGTFIRLATAAIIALMLAAIGSGQTGSDPDDEWDTPAKELQIARLKYSTTARAGSRGISQPIWAVDYPLADQHFFEALTRLTKIEAADDSAHLEATDERIFRYPFLWMQQPGRGRWTPTPEEVKNLREYFDRGGFMIVDDFHSDYEWEIFQRSIEEVFPDRPIVDIPDEDSMMNLFFILDRRLPAPGHRHLARLSDGTVVADMEGTPAWRGIYDKNGHLQVVALFNMDMGDAWEHADDPSYPAPMTLDAYRLGVNIVMYSMTH
jgi:hypothetical protein